MEVDIIKTIFETLGPAAAAFGIMYLWLRSVRQELNRETEAHHRTRERFEKLQQERIEEMQKHVKLLEAFKELISTDKPSTIGSSPKSHG